MKKITQADNYLKIFIETKATTQTCPCCHQPTKQIHDYREQKIKDLPLQFKDCYLILRKRRYRCKCGKRFFEKYHFLARYQQRTTRLTQYIANELRNSVSIKAVADKANVSHSTVTRILDTIHYSCSPLKDAIAIDDLKEMLIQVNINVLLLILRRITLWIFYLTEQGLIFLLTLKN